MVYIEEKSKKRETVAELIINVHAESTKKATKVRRAILGLLLNENLDLYIDDPEIRVETHIHTGESKVKIEVV